MRRLARLVIPAVVGGVIFTGAIYALSATDQNTGRKLSVVGNDGKCSLSSGSTFRFVGHGYTPNGKVQVLVYYPKGHTFSFGHEANPYGFYWYHKNFGIYQTDAKGDFSSRPWDCRDGPRNTPDFVGKYSVIAVDLTFLHKETFKVTP